MEDRQREALLVECRARKIEPPGRTRIEKVLVAARGKWERTFCARTISRLGEAGAARDARLDLAPAVAVPRPRTSAEAATRSATELR